MTTTDDERPAPDRPITPPASPTPRHSARRLVFTAVVLLLVLSMRWQCLCIQGGPGRLTSLRARTRAADIVVDAALEAHGLLGERSCAFSATYRVVEVIKGDVAPADLLRVVGPAHLPFVDDSAPWSRPGNRVLLFAEATLVDGVVTPVDGANGIIDWDWMHYGSLHHKGEVRERILERLADLVQRPHTDDAELEWLLALLEDPLTSQHAVLDLRLNSRRLPRELAPRRPRDGSDLRARMDAGQLGRLVDVLAGGHPGEVLIDAATLLADVQDEGVDRALRRLLEELLAVHEDPAFAGKAYDHPVFAYDFWADSAIFSAAPLLRTLAPRHDDPRLAELCGEFEALGYLDDEKPALVREALAILDG